MRSLAHRSFLLGMALVVGSVLTLPRSAHADIIDLSAAGCAGLVCSPLLFPGGTLTLAADGGTFTTKTRNGATGLGISGTTRGEIDSDEVVHATFSSPVALDAFTILFLYNGGEFGDPNETARISINGGSIVATLTANAENSAVWSLGGASIISCGDTSITGTGCFRIANPFGTTLVTDIAFTAVSAGSTLPNDSDFSLGAIEASVVPEPASLVLFATGSFALLARRKRRQ